MQDYAHSLNQFTSWKHKEDARQMLLGRLIQIIQNTRAIPIGVAVSLDAFAALTANQQNAFKDPYYLAFQICTRGASTGAMFERPEQRVNLIYAFNSEFGTERGMAEQLWRFVKRTYPEGGWRLGTYTSATPQELCPLQAADLLPTSFVMSLKTESSGPMIVCGGGCVGL